MQADLLALALDDLELQHRLQHEHLLGRETTFRSIGAQLAAAPMQIVRLTRMSRPRSRDDDNKLLDDDLLIVAEARTSDATAVRESLSDLKEFGERGAYTMFEHPHERWMLMVHWHETDPIERLHAVGEYLVSEAA